MFKVLPTKVDAPLVPVVVKVIAPCFELNVDQSAEINAPLLVPDAFGRMKVCVDAAELIAKSVPLVPTAKFCT
jgi:hypothetical protein